MPELDAATLDDVEGGAKLRSWKQEPDSPQIPQETQLRTHGFFTPRSPCFDLNPQDQSRTCWCIGWCEVVSAATGHNWRPQVASTFQGQ